MLCPLDRHQRTIRTEEQDALLAAGQALPGQEFRGVDPVNRPVGWHFVRCPCQRRESRVPVVGRQHLLGDHPGWHRPQPADHRRNPHRSFPRRRPERPVEWSVRSALGRRMSPAALPLAKTMRALSASPAWSPDTVVHLGDKVRLPAGRAGCSAGARQAVRPGRIHLIRR
jgi:hypothetical protein